MSVSTWDSESGLFSAFSVFSAVGSSLGLSSNRDSDDESSSDESSVSGTSIHLIRSDRDFSDSDVESHVVRSARKRAFGSFQNRIRNIRDAMAIKDYYSMQSEFDDLAEEMYASKPVLEEGIPWSLVRFLVVLKEYVKETLSHKLTYSKLKARYKRALNQMNVTLNIELDDYLRKCIADKDVFEKILVGQGHILNRLKIRIKKRNNSCTVTLHHLDSEAHDSSDEANESDEESMASCGSETINSLVSRISDRGDKLVSESDASATDSDIDGTVFHSESEDSAMSDDSDSTGSSSYSWNEVTVGALGATRKSIMQDGSARAANVANRRAFRLLQTHLENIRAAMRTANYCFIQNEFEALTNAMAIVKPVLKEGFPWPLIVFLTEVEDFAKNRLANKASFEKLTGREARALKRLKLKSYEAILKFHRKDSAIDSPCHFSDGYRASSVRRHYDNDHSSIETGSNGTPSDAEIDIMSVIENEDKFDVSDLSGSEDETRFKTPKEKAHKYFQFHIRGINEAMNAYDHVKILDGFTNLTRTMVKAKGVLAEGIPWPLMRFLVELEDYVKDQLADKKELRKIPEMHGRALVQMRFILRVELEDYVRMHLSDKEAFKQLLISQGRALNQTKLSLRKGKKCYKVVLKYPRKRDVISDNDFEHSMSVLRSIGVVMPAPPAEEGNLNTILESEEEENVEEKTGIETLGVLSEETVENGNDKYEIPHDGHNHFRSIADQENDEERNGINHDGGIEITSSSYSDCPHAIIQTNEEAKAQQLINQQLRNEQAPIDNTGDSDEKETVEESSIHLEAEEAADMEVNAVIEYEESVEDYEYISTAEISTQGYGAEEEEGEDDIHLTDSKEHDVGDSSGCETEASGDTCQAICRDKSRYRNSKLKDEVATESDEALNQEDEVQAQEEEILEQEDCTCNHSVDAPDDEDVIEKQSDDTSDHNGNVPGQIEETPEIQDEFSKQNEKMLHHFDQAMNETISTTIDDSRQTLESDSRKDNDDFSCSNGSNAPEREQPEVEDTSADQHPVVKIGDKIRIVAIRPELKEKVAELEPLTLDCSKANSVQPPILNSMSENTLVPLNLDATASTLSCNEDIPEGYPSLIEGEVHIPTRVESPSSTKPQHTCMDSTDVYKNYQNQIPKETNREAEFNKTENQGAFEHLVDQIPTQVALPSAPLNPSQLHMASNRTPSQLASRDKNKEMLSDWSVSVLQALAAAVRVDVSEAKDREEMVQQLLDAGESRPQVARCLAALFPLAQQIAEPFGRPTEHGGIMDDMLVKLKTKNEEMLGEWSESVLLALAKNVDVDLSKCSSRREMVTEILVASETRPDVANYLETLAPASRVLSDKPRSVKTPDVHTPKKAPATRRERVLSSRRKLALSPQRFRRKNDWTTQHGNLSKSLKTDQPQSSPSNKKDAHATLLGKKDIIKAEESAKITEGNDISHGHIEGEKKSLDDVRTGQNDDDVKNNESNGKINGRPTQIMNPREISTALEEEIKGAVPKFLSEMSVQELQNIGVEWDVDVGESMLKAAIIDRLLSKFENESRKW